MSTTTFTTTTKAASTLVVTSTLSRGSSATGNLADTNHSNNNNPSEPLDKDSSSSSALQNSSMALRSRAMELTSVLSDDKHYGTFLCTLCNKLLALDAVVTNQCSHAFCWSCFQDHVQRHVKQESPEQPNHDDDNNDDNDKVDAHNKPLSSYHIPCPHCQASVTSSSNKQEATTCMEVPVSLPASASSNGSEETDKSLVQNSQQQTVIRLDIQRLEVAQPMAYQAMTWIQVACCRKPNGNSGNKNSGSSCPWSGNYGDYPHHLAQECTCPPAASSMDVPSSKGVEKDPKEQQETTAAEKGRNARPSLQRTKSMPSLWHWPFTSHPSFSAPEHQQPWPLGPGNPRGDQLPQRPNHFPSPTPGRRFSAGPGLMATGSYALLSPSSNSSVLSRNNGVTTIASTSNWSSCDSMDSNGPPLCLRKSLSLRNISRDSANDFPPPAPHRTNSPYGAASRVITTPSSGGAAGAFQNHRRAHSATAELLPNIPRWEDTKPSSSNKDKDKDKDKTKDKDNSKDNSSIAAGTSNSLLSVSIPEDGGPAVRTANHTSSTAENSAAALNQSNSNRDRDGPPNFARRSKSVTASPASTSKPSLSSSSNHKQPLQTNSGNQQPLPHQPSMNTGKPVPEDKRLRKSRRKSSQTPSNNLNSTSHKDNTNGEDDESSGDGEGGLGENWANTSINSLTAWGNNHSSMANLPVTLTLNETIEASPRPSATAPSVTPTTPGRSSRMGSDIGVAAAAPPSLLVSPGATTDRSKVQSILAKAEKLKKQANAKFNKGDFNVARSLYSDGIRCMEGVPNRCPKEAEMLSNMHSNRAVTYFREKNFKACIEDCDVAVQYDPYYEKSWIRKWRALMALGQFDRALDCLEMGLHSLPDSAKIRKELNKTQADMDTATQARELLFQKRDYAAVKEKLRPLIKNAAMDNIAILHLASRADAYLGLMDSSMDKINRALRYNPQQADGLAVRGAIMYLAGETDKGLHLLQEAYGIDKENKSIKTELQQCHRTHTSLTKGRSCVKRGRYLDAIEHFTAAIRERTLVPDKTPLYAMVRCERAEAWMLSNKYPEALKDCEDVLSAQKENATAWTIRAEILVAMGKAEDAQKELLAIRKEPWGMDNTTIEEGYRRVDFELRVQKADEELLKFVATLEQGLGNVRPAVNRGESVVDLNSGSKSRLDKDDNRQQQQEQRRASLGSRVSVGSNGSGAPMSAQRSSERGNRAEPQQRRATRRRNPQKSSSTTTHGSTEYTDSVLLSPQQQQQHQSSSNLNHNNNNNNSSGRSPPVSPQRRPKTGVRRAASSRRLLSASTSSGDDGRPQSQVRRSSVERQGSSRRLTQASGGGGGGGGSNRNGGLDDRTGGGVHRQSSRRHLSSSASSGAPPEQAPPPSHAHSQQRRMSAGTQQSNEDWNGVRPQRPSNKQRSMERRMSAERGSSSNMSDTTNQYHERSNTKRM